MCKIHATCMQHTCNMHATCMQHTCNIHATYMQYIRMRHICNPAWQHICGGPPLAIGFDVIVMTYYLWPDIVMAAYLRRSTAGQWL